jgi:hypothetical protein
MFINAGSSRASAVQIRRRISRRALVRGIPIVTKDTRIAVAPEVPVNATPVAIRIASTGVLMTNAGTEIWANAIARAR